MKQITLHLISDATGETISSISRTIFAKFEEVKLKRYLWAMIHSKEQLQKIFDRMEKSQNNIVMMTIAMEYIEQELIEYCQKNRILCIDPLKKIITEISDHIGSSPVHKVAKQYVFDDSYTKRIDAMNFTIAHDDGQHSENYQDAEIIILGPSRTSKSPTSIFLALKGFKTANVPLILNRKPDPKLFLHENIFFIGLTVNPERLIEIRKSRLLSVNEYNQTSYTDAQQVIEEVAFAKKLCLSNNIPVIDVTRKSVEEIAATIIQMYYDWKKKPL